MPKMLIGLACLLLAAGCSASFDESEPYEIATFQHVFACGELGVIWVGDSVWESSTRTPMAWLNEQRTYEVRIQGDAAQIVSGDVSITLNNHDDAEFYDLSCSIPDY